MFETFGIIENLNSKSERRVSYSGRPKTRADQIIDWARESVQESIKRSLCKRSQSFNLSLSICQRVIVADMKLLPFRIYIKQKLTIADKTKRKVRD